MSAKTILYVEDNEMNRKIVRQLLKKTTYQLVEAHGLGRADFSRAAGVARLAPAQCLGSPTTA